MYDTITKMYERTGSHKRFDAAQSQQHAVHGMSASIEGSLNIVETWAQEVLHQSFSIMLAVSCLLPAMLCKLQNVLKTASSVSKREEQIDWELVIKHRAEEYTLVVVISEVLSSQSDELNKKNSNIWQLKWFFWWREELGDDKLWWHCKLRCVKRSVTAWCAVFRAQKGSGLWEEETNGIPWWAQRPVKGRKCEQFCFF